MEGMGYGEENMQKDSNDCDIVSADVNFYCNNEFGSAISNSAGGSFTK